MGHEQHLLLSEHNVARLLTAIEDQISQIFPSLLFLCFVAPVRTDD